MATASDEKASAVFGFSVVGPTGASSQGAFAEVPADNTTTATTATTAAPTRLARCIPAPMSGLDHEQSDRRRPGVATQCNDQYYAV